MSSTPSKAETSFSSLTPVRLLDSPRTAPHLLTTKSRLDQISKNLQENFTKWQAAQKRGQSLCNSIEAVKAKCFESKTPGGTMFPEELKPFCDKLVIVVSVFEDVVKATAESLRQLNALAKLEASSEDVIYRTWLLNDFVKFTKTVLEKYEREFVIKKFVAEEIAHCRDRSELVRISSLWEYPFHVDDAVRAMFVFIAEEVRVK